MVTSMSGAKIKDINDKLSRDSTKYRKIMLVVGTNDSGAELNVEETSHIVSDLLQTASDKVSAASDVIISSIAPRVDNRQRQRRVDYLNTLLQDVSRRLGATSISHDKSFCLFLFCFDSKSMYILRNEYKDSDSDSDGMPNDGYLNNGGVHLNKRGCARLTANLGLIATPASNATVDRPPDRRLKRRAKIDHDDGWQTTRAKGRPVRADTYRDDRWETVSERGRSGRNQIAATASATSTTCGFCGERNHRDAHCRHGIKLQCHTCGRLGHNSKVHSG